MKIRELYKYAAIMGIILIFSASGAIAAEEVEPPTTCDCFGLDVEVITDPDGKFPVESTCGTDPITGEDVPCWKYEYTSNTGASAYAQTVPGLGHDEPFLLYPAYTFSNVTLYNPAVGTDISKACFGQNVYERRVIDFTAAPSGDPVKFGYTANLSGVGWTTLYFKKGNSYCSCPIAGPDYADEPRYIKTAIKILFFGETRVRFEINYTNCTYRAFQEFPLVNGGEIELTQSPEADITITIDGDTGLVRESQSPSECRELSAAYGTATCSVYILGGFYITIPFGCSP